jgi:hypothetical protein
MYCVCTIDELTGREESQRGCWGEGRRDTSEEGEILKSVVNKEYKYYIAC